MSASTILSRSDLSFDMVTKDREVHLVAIICFIVFVE